MYFCEELFLLHNALYTEFTFELEFESLWDGGEEGRAGGGGGGRQQQC